MGTSVKALLVVEKRTRGRNASSSRTGRFCI